MTDGSWWAHLPGQWVVMTGILRCTPGWLVMWTGSLRSQVAPGEARWRWETLGGIMKDNNLFKMLLLLYSKNLTLSIIIKCKCHRRTVVFAAFLLAILCEYISQYPTKSIYLLKGEELYFFNATHMKGHCKVMCKVISRSFSWSNMKKCFFLLQATIPQKLLILLICSD